MTATTVLADDRPFTPAIPDPPLPGLTAAATLPAPLAAALAAKGESYRPRTDHLREDGAPVYTNRLVLETSPYLLQHAHNPVSWYPWSDEAFARAGAETKLVLLSVGYSTCHWCHVMERESFEDVEIAAFINRNFVAIKVDREERPDVDAVYMTAVHLLAGRGGWPMTVVLNPEREPIFGGTYFPARDGDRGAHRGFLSILRQLTLLAESDPVKLAEAASSITASLKSATTSPAPGELPGAEPIREAVAALASVYDDRWGGFGGAPKFPRPVALELLARHDRRTGDRRSREMLARTLERMAAGGLHDQVGGGFHRYSTDGQWLVPHFEKMLYDNAQLTCAYLDGYQITGRAEFAAVARKTLDYVLREMTSPAGGFYSATDADSPDGRGGSAEGLFFTWTPGELEEVLGVERAARFAEVYGVNPGGNFEGRSILHLPAPIEAAARGLGVEANLLEAALAADRAALYASRAERLPPLLDDKIIAAWNGLMISAFAQAATVLDEERYAEAASVAARYLLDHQRVDGYLLRTSKQGEARHEAYLDDYAFLIAGLLDLFEATFDPRWLREARALQRVLDDTFADPAGAYYYTGSRHAALLTRDKPDYDGAEPSGNSVAILNLLRLEQLTGDPDYRRRAEAGLEAFAQTLARRAESAPKLLSALDFYLDEPLQVAIVTRPGDDPASLLAEVRRAYLPNRILAVAAEGEELDSQRRELPFLEDKIALGGKPTAYVCRGHVCDEPTTDPTKLREQLAAVTPLPR